MSIHLCRSRGSEEQLAVFVNYQGLKPCARIVASHLSEWGDSAIAMGYILGKTAVDAWGDLDAGRDKENGGAAI